MSILGKLYQRVTNLTLVFVLAVSAASAFAPFIMASKVSAAPYTSYASTGFGGLTWSPDRSTPSGGYTVSGDSLTLNINSAISPIPAAFYLTEGVQSALPGGIDSVKADLYIDPAWDGKPVRAGIWGVSSDGSSSAWPIIEFTNDYPGAGFDGLRVWDTNTGDWYNISTPAYGSTVNLEVAINSSTSEYEFYVNNALVKSYDTYGYDTFSAIIFNSRNSATGNALDNYSVSWSNLKLGTIDMVAPAVPENLAWTNTDGVVADGGITNLYNGAASWDASDSDTVSYIYRYWNDIPASSYKVGSPWETSIAGLVAPGVFNEGEGIHYFSVAAVDAAGNVSGFSAPFEITYDATAPVITVTGGDFTIEAGDTYVDQGATWTDNYDTPGGAATELSNNVNDQVPGMYYVTYGHTDTAGNASVVATRTVTVEDTTAPVVVLNGGDITLTEGEAYVELGATWTDLVDVSGVAVRSGSVNTSIPGVYVLTYSYTDAEGNTDSVDRVVTVKAKPVVRVITTQNIVDTTNTTSGANNAEVQGESNAEGVSSTSDQKSTETNKTDGNIFGLAWYWWLLILVALGALWWWIIGALKKRAEDK